MKISVAFVAIALAAATVQAVPLPTTILINDQLEVRAPTPGINGVTDVLKDASTSTSKGLEEAGTSLDLGKGKEPKLDADTLLGKGKRSDNSRKRKADAGNTSHEAGNALKKLKELKVPKAPKATDFEPWLFKSPINFSIHPNGQKAFYEHMARLKKENEIVENKLNTLSIAREQAPLVDNLEKMQHFATKKGIISSSLKRYQRSAASRKELLEEFELDKGPEAWMHKHYEDLYPGTTDLKEAWLKKFERLDGEHKKRKDQLDKALSEAGPGSDAAQRAKEHLEAIEPIWEDEKEHGVHQGWRD